MLCWGSGLSCGHLFLTVPHAGLSMLLLVTFNQRGLRESACVLSPGS